MTEDRDNLPELPTGWVWVSWEQIGFCQNGRAFPSKEYQPSGVKLLRPGNLHKSGNVLWTEENTRYLPEQYAKEFLSYIVGSEELIINLTAQSLQDEFLGRICLTEQSEYCLLNQRIARLTPIEIPPKYVLWLFKSRLFRKFVDSLNTGSLIQHMFTSQIEKFNLPLAPLNEQRRIVAKIEALKARSQRVKEELEAIPALLDQFRQSVLAAAFRGDLTADWREKNPDVEPASELWEQIKEQILTLDKFNHESDLEEYHLPNLPESWIWLNVASLGNVKGGKRLPKGESLVDEDTGYPYIKAGNLKNGTVILDELQYIPAHIQPSIKNYIVSAGDVYITIVGACIGDAGIIPDELDGANLTENAAKICDIRGCKNQYLALWLRSSLCQGIIRTKILSAAQGKLALARIKTIPVPLPPEKEQLEIINKVGALFNTADRIEQQYKETKAYLDQLDRSILAKAFRGELVPQDPNDEPASVLLERIRAEREKLDTKKKAKGKTEKKSRKAKPEAAEPEQLSLPGFE